MKKIKLICIPYAGGSGMIYTKWKNFLDSEIQLIPVELAGRGKRFKEKFYENFEMAVDDIYNKVSCEVRDSEYVVFGHSMGSLLGYELLVKLKSKGFHDPKTAIFSGRFPPYIFKSSEKLSDASDEQIKKVMSSLGGTPKEFLIRDDLLDIFIPILRNDYRIIENYEYKHGDYKFDFDIKVFYGEADDNIRFEDLLKWKESTTKSLDFFRFNGGHFYIHDEIEKVIQNINNILIS